MALCQIQFYACSAFLTLFCLGLVAFQGESGDNIRFKEMSIMLTMFAGFLESVNEPLYVLMLFKMDFKIRAKAESVSIFFKSITIYLLIKYDYGLLSYGLAQVIYSLCLLVGYFFQFDSNTRFKLFKSA